MLFFDGAVSVALAILCWKFCFILANEVSSVRLSILFKLELSPRSVRHIVFGRFLCLVTVVFAFLPSSSSNSILPSWSGELMFRSCFREQNAVEIVIYVSVKLKYHSLQRTRKLNDCKRTSSRVSLGYPSCTYFTAGRSSRLSRNCPLWLPMTKITALVIASMVSLCWLGDVIRMTDGCALN